MKTHILVLAVSTTAFVSLGAFAQDKGQSKQYAACMNKSGNTTTDMVECIAAETKREDVHLNTAYRALMAGLSPARKAQLQEAQRAWIKFRDANCSFYFDPDGGSLARIEGYQCELGATAARGRELEGLKQ